MNTILAGQSDSAAGNPLSLFGAGSTEHSPLRAIPMRRPDVLVRDANGMCILVNVVTGNYYLLEGVAGRIVELCDGFRDVSEMREELCTQYNVDSAEVQADIKEFIVDLVREGLLDIQLGEAFSFEERSGFIRQQEPADFAPFQRDISECCDLTRNP